MITSNSIGVDIQEEQIAVVWLQNGFRKVRLAGNQVFTIPEGKNRVERLLKAGDLLNQFIADNRISSPELYLAFPGKKTVVRNLSFPLSIKENFRETIRYELEKYVPFQEDQVYHDSRIIFEDKKKKELTILLTVVKKEDFSPYLRMCEHLGSGVSGLESTYSAVVNGLTFLPGVDCPSTFISLHKSGQRYLVALVNNNRLLTGRSLLSADAEAGPAELFFPELKTCQTQGIALNGPMPVVLGSGVEVPAGLQGDHPDFRILEVGFEETVPSAEYIAAYGMAMKGLKNVPLQVNLMPRGLRKKPARKTLYLIYGLIVLNLVLGITWSGSMLMKKRLVLEDLGRQISQLKSEVKGLDNLELAVDTQRAKISSLNDFQANNPPAIVIVNELTGIIPETVWIDTFRLGEGSVELKGVAESASDLLPLLESSPLFNNVVFTSTISKTKDGKEEFDIKLKIAD